MLVIGTQRWYYFSLTMVRYPVQEAITTLSEVLRDNTGKEVFESLLLLEEAILLTPSEEQQRNTCPCLLPHYMCLSIDQLSHLMIYCCPS